MSYAFSSLVLLKSIFSINHSVEKQKRVHVFFFLHANEWLAHDIGKH